MSEHPGRCGEQQHRARRAAESGQRDPATQPWSVARQFGLRDKSRARPACRPGNEVGDVRRQGGKPRHEQSRVGDQRGDAACAADQSGEYAGSGQKRAVTEPDHDAGRAAEQVSCSTVPLTSCRLPERHLRLCPRGEVNVGVRRKPCGRRIEHRAGRCQLRRRDCRVCPAPRTDRTPGRAVIARRTRGPPPPAPSFPGTTTRKEVITCLVPGFAGRVAGVPRPAR